MPSHSLVLSLYTGFFGGVFPPVARASMTGEKVWYFALFKRRFGHNASETFCVVVVVVFALSMLWIGRAWQCTHTVPARVWQTGS